MKTLRTDGIEDEIAKICQTARDASHWLALASTQVKNTALHTMADALEAALPAILDANAKDVEAAQREGVAAHLIDRLQLSEAVVRRTAQGVREVAALPDPVGEELERIVRRTDSSCAEFVFRSASLPSFTKRGRKSRRMPRRLRSKPAMR